jgi:hypothetical protein
MNCGRRVCARRGEPNAPRLRCRGESSGLACLGMSSPENGANTAENGGPERAGSGVLLDPEMSSSTGELAICSCKSFWVSPQTAPIV